MKKDLPPSSFYLFQKESQSRSDPSLSPLSSLSLNKSTPRPGEACGGKKERRRRRHLGAPDPRRKGILFFFRVGISLANFGGTPPPSLIWRLGTSERGCV